MENLFYDGQCYDRIFYDQNGNLIKYSAHTVDAWNALINKHLSFVNNPIMVQRQESCKSKFYLYESTILLPFLKDYSTFYDLYFEFNSKEALLLLKKCLNLLKILHNNDVYHGDIFSKNIMIKDFDVKFIDLDASIINDFISNDNTYKDDDDTIYNKKRLTIVDDKIELVKMFLHYFVSGNFKIKISDRVRLDNINFPKDVLDEFKSYFYQDRFPKDDYYFEDIIDFLLSNNYESVILTKKL